MTDANWPYHLNRNTGEMVKCKSNPCTLHSEGEDVKASSVEDAYRKFYMNDNARGLSADAPAPAPAPAKKDDDYSDIILPGTSGAGYMGGGEFKGGKYDATRSLPQKEAAALMRQDFKKLKARGAFPRDWKVSLRTQYGDHWILYIKYNGSNESSNPYRRMEWDDMWDDSNADAERTARMVNIDLDNENGNSDHTKEEFDRYVAMHNTTVLKSSAKKSLDTIMACAEQYSYDKSNIQFDYFESHRTTTWNGFIDANDK